MELWIRSQDKERLVKVYDIYIEGRLIRANFKEHYSGCNYVDLGEYNSKERALQVLDEIQNILQPKPLVIVRPSEEMVELLGARQIGKVKKMEENIEYKEILTYVYQMPEE